MEKTIQAKTVSLFMTIAVILFAVGVVHGQDLNSLLNVAAAKNQAAQESQAKIDKIVEKTRDLKTEYKGVSKEIDGLLVYNTLLQRQIDNQLEEMGDLENSIEQVTVIERQVLPLMLRMIDGLEQFVQLDVPFLAEERGKRVGFLKSLAERSDVTVSEKFRRVLEAYQIENDYGRTIEAYRGSLDLDGSSREVDFLRIGRVGLYYQSPDAEVSGMWDQKARKWTPLASEFRNQIRTGLRIARKQVAPDLLSLPIPAPESAQ